MTRNSMETSKDLRDTVEGLVDYLINYDDTIKDFDCDGWWDVMLEVVKNTVDEFIDEATPKIQYELCIEFGNRAGGLDRGIIDLHSDFKDVLRQMAFEYVEMEIRDSINKRKKF